MRRASKRHPDPPNPNTNTNTPTHTPHTRTHPHTRTPAHTRTHTHTRARARARAHTHAHTPTRPVPPPYHLASSPLLCAAFDRWDLCPNSLGRALRAFWRRYQLPLIVTESGIADGDAHDERRVRYLSGCLRAVHAALADGVDVRGYTYWSLLDNFECAEPPGPRTPEPLAPDPARWPWTQT